MSRELYDDLYRQVEAEIQHGDYRRALKLSRRALAVARKLEEQDLVHRAISNLSVIYPHSERSAVDSDCHRICSKRHASV